MAKSVTFRLDDDKLQFLDQLAKSQDRDRSYLINQAVENYLEVRRWHIEEIKKAVAEADAGHFASAEEVQAAFDSFKRQP
jgi:RHH-type transcriptional regulator, rel operon repressor / antitoxin RelB